MPEKHAVRDRMQQIAEALHIALPGTTKVIAVVFEFNDRDQRMEEKAIESVRASYENAEDAVDQVQNLEKRLVRLEAIADKVRLARRKRRATAKRKTAKRSKR